MLTRLWDLAESAGHAATWFGLSLIFIHNGDLERAEIAARRAVASSITDSLYLSRLAWIQAHRGKLTDAIDTMRALVQHAPGGSVFAQQLADYEAQAGNVT